METIKLLTWISIYVGLMTILFNVLRFGIKLNLPSSIILSASLSFLIPRICIIESVAAWFQEYIMAIIILISFIVIIAITARLSGKSNKPDNDTVS